MKILLTGATGQVGFELSKILPSRGELLALDRTRLNLSRPETIAAVVRAAKPNLIVNAAAYTAVDRAESEPQIAMAVNGTAPGVLAEEARRLGAALVHFSTDYVFDGTKQGPYAEDDAVNPLNAYGRSKLAGERAVAQSGARHLILRTSWVYDATRRNFLTTMLGLAKTRKELRVVDDQRGAPTWAGAIAVSVVQVLKQEWQGGIYHLTSAGETTWFGFTRAILDKARVAPRPALLPISSEEYPTPARRPRNSVLDNTKLMKTFNVSLPHWESALEACLRGD